MTLPPGTQTVEQRPVPVNANAFPPPQGIRAANPGPTTERSNVLGGAQANQTQFHQPRCPTTQYFSVFGRRFVSTTSLWQPNLSYQPQNMAPYYPGLNFIPQHHPAQQDMCETCDPQVSCGVELGASQESPGELITTPPKFKNFKKKILALWLCIVIVNFIQVELYVKIHVMCPCILLFCNDYKSFVRTNKYFEKKYHMIPEFFRHGSNRPRGIAVVEFIKLLFHRTVKDFLVRGCSRINWKIVLLPQIGSSCRPSLAWGKQNSLSVFINHWISLKEGF